MQSAESTWEDRLWVVICTLVLIALSWELSGCGTINYGTYLTTTRQGVDVYYIGDPNMEDIAELDDAIDLTIQRWRERFGASDKLIGRFYENLASLSITISDIQIQVPHGENKTTWHDGMQKGDFIYLKKRWHCWGWTPLVHELAHWMLWLTNGDPQGTHPPGPVWELGDSFERRVTGELIVDGGCHRE